jgi:hypothetical protein
MTVLDDAGAACFGLTIGYITYRTLVRTTEKTAISDLAAVIGAVGGAAITTLFRAGTELFAWYSIGLLLGVVAYGVLYHSQNGDFNAVMGRTGRSKPPPTGPNAPQ